MDTTASLYRIRWAVRAVLALGVGASIAGNILHAEHDPVAQAIAAWAPAALLITIELISKVPVHGRVLASARLAATALIAGIAAWVSYWHQVAVAVRYGETGASPYLLPLSVDGLVVVASICLVELADRIRAAERPSSTPVPDPIPPQPAPPEIPRPAPQPSAPEIVRPAKPAVPPDPDRRPQGVHERGGQRLRGGDLRADAIALVLTRGLSNADLAAAYDPPLSRRTAETFGAAARKLAAAPTNGHRPAAPVNLS